MPADAPTHTRTAAMAKFGIFRDSEMATDCDQCGGRVDVLKGGACVRCRRILCSTHLHGSFVRRLATDLGAQMLCVRCRTRDPHDEPNT
jgi:hypothetical protein